MRQIAAHAKIELASETFRGEKSNSWERECILSHHIRFLLLGDRYASTSDSIDFDSFAFTDEEDTKWTEERESDESCTSRGEPIVNESLIWFQAWQSAESCRGNT